MVIVPPSLFYFMGVFLPHKNVFLRFLLYLVTGVNVAPPAAERRMMKMEETPAAPRRSGHSNSSSFCVCAGSQVTLRFKRRPARMKV